jgi:hypothetical protein
VCVNFFLNRLKTCRVHTTTNSIFLSALTHFRCFFTVFISKFSTNELKLHVRALDSLSQSSSGVRVKMKLFWFLLAFSAQYFIETSGLRVLGIIPFGSKSHFAIGNSILRTLHEAGHDITSMNAFPAKKQEKGFRDVKLTRIMEIFNKGN